MDTHSPAARPLHVCHIVLSLEPGGLENGVVNVVNGLDAAEFRSSVCCLRRRGEFAARIRAGTPIATLDVQSGNDPGAVLRLARLLRASRVDIVHTRNVEPCFYGVPAAQLAGVAAVIHSEHGRTFPERRRRALAQRLLLRGVDRAFTVSADLRTRLARELHLDEGRFEVIRNGVDVRAFASLESREHRDPAERPLRIGSVGRLARVKNYPLLMRAFARLPPEPRCRLVLVGEGPERAALERLALELGIANRCELTGHRDDVAEVLRSLDVFVLPSASEGMSNTLLEAMAAGLAVLASDVGGNREVIAPGRSGLLFGSQDLEGAVAQLRALLESRALRLSLGREAAARARAEFSIEAMLQRYEQLYREVWRRKGMRRRAIAPAG
jgi:sugar transferase (PEP-CTERM/EpsH1 system associated)